MTTLQPGTQVEADPVDDYDVTNKKYTDDAVEDHETSVTEGETGPTIGTRVGIRAAFVWWSGIGDNISGHGYYQVQMATNSGFTSIVDDVETKTNWATFDGLTTGVTYYWRVRGIDAAGNTSDWATTVSDSGDQVVEDDLGDGSVTTVKIDDLAVTTAKIGNAQITTAKIANLAVDTAKIASAAITNAKIANLAVTDAKIKTLTASKLTAGTIDSETINVAGGTAGIIKSDNFSSGSAGWRIRGNGDAEFNSITLRDGIVGIEALDRRVEADTYGANSHPTGTNSDDLSLTVTKPSWASSCSVIAIGNVGMIETDPGTRFAADLDIAGSSITAVEGSTDTTYDAIGCAHQRDFSPSGNFTVTLSWGAAPLSETPNWHAYLVVMVVWTK